MRIEGGVGGNTTCNLFVEDCAGNGGHGGYGGGCNALLSCSISLPSKDLKEEKHGYAAYETVVKVTEILGHIPSVNELLGMTATSEYYPLIYRPGAGGLRKYGQEALARNLYEACGGDTSCTWDEIYAFLAGYEPWWRTTNDATPESRAQDILQNLAENPYKTELDEDVRQIVDLEYASARGRGWTQGMVWNRPWQWRNMTEKPKQSGDLNANTGAALCVTLSEGTGYYGDYFWVVTARQDWCLKNPTDEENCK